MATSKKPYVQFSKKIVVAVFSSVTVITIASMIFAFLSGNAEEVTAAVKAYINYAMVVFAAYSGNSAVEKWLIHRETPAEPDE